MFFNLKIITTMKTIKKLLKRILESDYLTPSCMIPLK
jgi:hypothetical protein